jgi:hypothetical protein
VGAANALRDTSCLISRNENDSTRVPGKIGFAFAKTGSGFRIERQGSESAHRFEMPDYGQVSYDCLK